jgi:hypothetical protein
MMTLKMLCLNGGIKVEKIPGKMMTDIKLQCLYLLAHSICARLGATMLLTAPIMAKVEIEAEVVVVVVVMAEGVVKPSKSQVCWNMQPVWKIWAQ